MEEGGNVSSPKMRMCGYIWPDVSNCFVLSGAGVQRPVFTVPSWFLRSPSSLSVVLCSSLTSSRLRTVHSEDAQSSKVIVTLLHNHVLNVPISWPGLAVSRSTSHKGLGFGRISAGSWWRLKYVEFCCCWKHLSSSCKCQCRTSCFPQDCGLSQTEVAVGIALEGAAENFYVALPRGNECCSPSPQREFPQLSQYQ